MAIVLSYGEPFRDYLLHFGRKTPDMVPIADEDTGHVTQEADPVAISI
jgi:hypothetical protein